MSASYLCRYKAEMKVCYCQSTLTFRGNQSSAGNAPRHGAPSAAASSTSLENSSREPAASTATSPTSTNTSSRRALFSTSPSFAAFHRTFHIKNRGELWIELLSQLSDLGHHQLKVIFC